MLTETSRLRDFPTLQGITYLNTAAESIPPLCVGEALQLSMSNSQLQHQREDQEEWVGRLLLSKRQR